MPRATTFAIARVSMALAFTAAIPATASAHMLPQSGDEEVVVTGAKHRDEMVREYVRNMDQAVSTQPLARFDDEGVCPGAGGLSPEQNALLTARIRKIAEGAGIPVSKEAKCRTNVLVLVADDPAAMVKALRKMHPAFFRTISGAEITPPKMKEHSIVWHLEGRRDKFDEPVPYNAELDRYEVNSPMPGSRITLSMRPVFVASVVILDRKALAGLTITQVADYAAMRAFTEADPVRIKNSSTPTIMTILRSSMEDEVPASLTQWDLSYLRGLYSVDKMRMAGSQRAAISRDIRNELDGKTTKD